MPASHGRGVVSGFSRTGAAEPLTTVGRLMAERTTQSWTTVPHFFVAREIDAGALKRARETLLPAIERSHNVKVTHTDVIVARGRPHAGASPSSEFELDG